MAKTRLVSAIVVAGAIAIGVPAGLAWAGGPGGTVQDDYSSQAVGSGTFIAVAVAFGVVFFGSLLFFLRVLFVVVLFLLLLFLLLLLPVAVSVDGLAA